MKMSKNASPSFSESAAQMRVKYSNFISALTSASGALLISVMTNNTQHRDRVEWIVEF